MGCVLVMDDEGSVRRATARVLRGAGWRVIEADSPADLDALLLQHPEIEVVLSDLDMPDGGGVRVLAESPVPVVIYSGNERGIHERNAEHWLLKPAGAQELDQALRVALSGIEP